jgi:NTP pyrophosphatase (non-canonical NTP hydrolase)
MTLEEAQEQVDQWIKTVGVRYFNELTNMAMLTEEVGEVARIIARRYGEQSEKESDKNKEALAKNLAKKSVRDADRHHNNPKLK